MKKNMKKIEASSLCEASSWVTASYATSGDVALSRFLGSVLSMFGAGSIISDSAYRTLDL